MGSSLPEPPSLSWGSRTPVGLGKESLELHRDGMGQDEMGWDEVGWDVWMGGNRMGWDEMGQGGRSGTLLEVQNLWTQAALTSPKSRGFSCQAKTIVSFLELLLRKSRRLHLLCTGMFPRET